MNLSKHAVSELKRIVLEAKKTYYTSGKSLKVDRGAVSEEVADLLVNAVLSRGKVVMKYGDPIPRRIEITDGIYDVAEAALKEAGIDLGTRASAVKVKKTDAVLPFAMPGLDKAYPGDGKISKYVAKNRGPYMASTKLDGLSLFLEYRPGEPLRIYTGTTLTTGKDVSFLAPHLRLPTFKPSTYTVLRAEGLIPRSTFESKWLGKFKSNRNLASGVFNKAGAHEAIGDIDVIVYEVVTPRGTPSEQLDTLKRKGFHVVSYKLFDTLNESMLSAALRYFKRKSAHDIDGVVVTRDSKTAVQTGSLSSVAVAYKENDEVGVEAVVTSVVWKPSKYGYLKPRINIKPVKIGDITVTYATGHNAAYIEENRIGPGSVITVVRSGEVIPYVTGVVKATKAQLPDEEEFGSYHWSKNHVDLILDEGRSHETAQIKTLTEFIAKGLKIEFLKQANVEKLIAAGIDTPEKFVRVTEQKLYKVGGFKEGMVKKIYDQIQAKCKAADIVNVAANSGVLARGMGTTKLRVIDNSYGILKLINRSPKSRAAIIADLPGFSEGTAAALANDFSKLGIFLDTLSPHVQFAKKVKTRVVGKKLAGQSVAFTGFRDEELSKFIVEQGGAVTNGVQKATTMLLCKAYSASQKFQAAEARGIRILTRDEFVSKYM